MHALISKCLYAHFLFIQGSSVHACTEHVRMHVGEDGRVVCVHRLNPNPTICFLTLSEFREKICPAGIKRMAPSDTPAFDITRMRVHSRRAAHTHATQR